jgi:hypothetical protein
VSNGNCCDSATRDRGNVPRPESRWRRGSAIAAWVFPGATLALLPKCPVCLAAYVALASGIGISIQSAAVLRTSLLVLSIATLLCLALKYLLVDRKAETGNRIESARLI